MYFLPSTKPPGTKRIRLPGGSMTVVYDMSKYVAPHENPRNKQQQKRKVDLVKTAKTYNWIVSRRNGRTVFEKKKQFPSRTLVTTITQISPREFRVERVSFKNGKMQPGKRVEVVKSIRGIIKREYAASIRHWRTYRENL